MSLSKLSFDLLVSLGLSGQSADLVWKEIRRLETLNAELARDNINLRAAIANQQKTIATRSPCETADDRFHKALARWRSCEMELAHAILRAALPDRIRELQTHKFDALAQLRILADSEFWPIPTPTSDP